LKLGQDTIGFQAVGGQMGQSNRVSEVLLVVVQVGRRQDVVVSIGVLALGILRIHRDIGHFLVGNTEQVFVAA